jgi:hypothetical protein
MIKFLNAYTEELDDIDAAVADILRQLDLPKNLLPNAIGLVSCYYEFVETGVVAALVEKLPFDVIGCTAMASGINGHYGQEQLSLTVLTSDELTFAGAFSDEITPDNAVAVTQRAYKIARAKLSAEPSLIFALGPIMTDLCGETLVKALDEASGGKPIFGTLSNDTCLTYENARTFFNGAAHQYKLAAVLVAGAVKPRFFVTAISEKNIQREKGVITASDGSFLQEVNRLPLLDYLETLGIRKDGLAAITSIPILVDHGDGSKPVALSMYAFSERGALCGGAMPVGATITIAHVDYHSVIDTARETVAAALKEPDIHGILAIPCFSRILVASPKTDDEMALTCQLVGDRIPLHIGYSGGEICPVYDAAGDLVNRFHNLTYTLLVL